MKTSIWRQNISKIGDSKREDYKIIQQKNIDESHSTGNSLKYIFNLDFL